MNKAKRPCATEILLQTLTGKQMCNISLQSLKKEVKHGTLLPTSFNGNINQPHTFVPFLDLAPKFEKSLTCHLLLPFPMYTNTGTFKMWSPRYHLSDWNLQLFTELFCDRYCRRYKDRHDLFTVLKSLWSNRKQKKFIMKRLQSSDELGSGSSPN